MVFGKIKQKLSSLKMEGQLAKSAEKKLELANMKREARRYVKQAKSAGVNLSEDEALAYIKSKRRKERFSKLFTYASRSFGSFVGGGRSMARKRSRRRSRRKGGRRRGRRR
ncbi:hypothetical protein [Archaeoglobus profundus]|uniref:Uncharacterized protein n=1 Tax=Archaeoglobus profundus (strain DSM 5631 / JCM 9629 / NBRC 100127 / Av18) TaxID=572546 RepID=D2RF27_ARCPA|nr:hypothetical protein [Archaeoglobus profundus]ADB58721.1 hypothetical protein Arcpr_1675 [Archaeoglobus profundus DSM 5631]